MCGDPGTDEGIVKLVAVWLKYGFYTGIVSYLLVLAGYGFCKVCICVCMSTCGRDMYRMNPVFV